MLFDAAELLGVPALFTEQNAGGLGPTMPERRSEAAGLFQKMTFDAWPDAGLLDALPDRRDLVVAGCKTHVGVLQTALGLPAAGRRVCLVRDAVGSRRAESKETAIRRLERDGLSPQRAYRRTEAVEACGQWCEVVSFNLYERSIADDHDEWARFHALGKPALIGELHLSPPKMFCLVRPGYLVVLLVQHTGSGGSEIGATAKNGVALAGRQVVLRGLIVAPRGAGTPSATGRN